MRTGTLRCWLFGHRFVTRQLTGGNYDYDFFTYHQARFCVRCGINKEKKGENMKNNWREEFHKRFNHEGWCDIPNGLGTRCNCPLGDYEDFMSSKFAELIEEIQTIEVLYRDDYANDIVGDVKGKIDGQLRKDWL